MGKKQNTNFQQKKKVTQEEILESINYKFSRDAEWFKRTVEKIDKTKDELDKKFYTEEKKKQKIDFIRKLKNKLKDYKDAVNFEEKYKKIRFFERRKLERMLKKINKEIAVEEGKEEKDEDKLVEMNSKKDKIVSDINYVKVLSPIMLVLPKDFEVFVTIPEE
jgi:hypothetical protein